MKITVACIMGNERGYLDPWTKQVEEIADEIVIVLDKGRIHDGTKKFLEDLAKKDNRYNIYERKWDTGTNQKNYCKSKCTGDWILFLDGDEILKKNCEDLKEVLKYAEKNGFDALSLPGHHFIYNLGFEDSTTPNHFWNARLIKNKDSIKFEGKNHAITDGYEKNGVNSCLIIYHLGYIKHLNKIMFKYNNDIDKGFQIHDKKFIETWKNAHILGRYPISRFDENKLKDLPDVLKKHFKLNEYLGDKDA